MRDIQATGSKKIYLVDDDIAADRKRAQLLFEGLKPPGVSWMGLINVATGKDTALLDLMKESGCVHLNLGMESINAASLAELNKRHNAVEDYGKIFDNLRSRGLFFSVNIILGSDHDNRHNFEETVDFLVRRRAPMVYMFILTRAGWDGTARGYGTSWTDLDQRLDMLCGMERGL